MKRPFEIGWCPHCRAPFSWTEGKKEEAIQWHNAARCPVLAQQRRAAADKNLELFDLSARPFAEVLLNPPGGRGAPSDQVGGLPRPS